MYVQGKNVLSSLQTDGVCVCLCLPPGPEAGGGGRFAGRKSDQMAENKADEEIHSGSREMK